MTSQRDKMAGSAADTGTAETTGDGRTPPPLVIPADGADAPARPPTSMSGTPMGDEDDLILAREDEPIAAEPGPAGHGEPAALAHEDELGTSAETGAAETGATETGAAGMDAAGPGAESVVPAGRGASVPVGDPAVAPGDPATTTAPGQRDVVGTARGVGEPATMPAPTGDMTGDAVEAETVTGEPVPGEPAARAPAAEPAAGTAAGKPATGNVPAAALAEQQWPEIMALFVDDPRASVERAATTASEITAALTATLEREQEHLRAGWRDNASTEDLRTALQQYRAYCGRLEGLG